MRFVYLILAHQDFAQLVALLGRLLADPRDHVILHIDRKQERAGRQALAGLAGRSNLILLENPIDVQWSGGSMCLATQRLIEAALALPHPFAYAHLLSGQDWPIASREQMQREIERDGGARCYLEVLPEEADHQVWRMEEYCSVIVRRGDPPALLVRKVMAYLAGRSLTLATFAAPRPNPFGPSWRKGWQWWSLPQEALPFAREALARVCSSGRLAWTKSSDEHVLPTAFYHSHFRGALAPYRRFVKWRPGAGSPELFGREDLAAIRASGAWFARKFRAEHDAFFLAVPPDVFAADCA